MRSSTFFVSDSPRLLRTEPQKRRTGRRRREMTLSGNLIERIAHRSGSIRVLVTGKQEQPTLGQVRSLAESGTHSRRPTYTGAL